MISGEFIMTHVVAVIMHIMHVGDIIDRGASGSDIIEVCKLPPMLRYKASSSGDTYLLQRDGLGPNTARNMVLSPASRSDISTLASVWPTTMRINPLLNSVFPNQTYDSSAPLGLENGQLHWKGVVL